MLRLLFLLLLTISLNALDLHKILMLESSSYYKPDGTIEWVNRKRGLDGERGCFQMTKGAWKQIAKKGEHFADLDDTKYAEDCAIRFLNKWNWRLRKWNASAEYKRRYDLLR